ncbi:MAG: DUF3772 domain-containing protein [Pseudomonadota bacterium]
MIHFYRFLAACLVALCAFVPTLAHAQAADISAPATATAPDYSAWEQVATRAEGAIEAGRASDEVLRDLRAEVAGWRSQFQAQLTVNDSRIATIREQIAALGPVPEDGTSEASEIAARRAELTDQLTRLTTPRRTAEEALSRANGIISEIDAIIRARQSQMLMNRGPVPVNPALWPNAVEALVSSIHSTGTGLAQSWRTDSQRAQAQNNLPVILLLVSVALVLLLRARAWTERLSVRLERRERRGSAGFAGFVVSLGQVLFPVLGFLALVTAIDLTGLYGPRGALIIDILVPMGAMIFGARWLGGRVFPVDEGVAPLLNLALQRRREGRLYASLLGGVFALALLLDRLAEFERYTEATVSVLTLPLIIISSLVLFRIGQLMRQHAKNESTTDGVGTAEGAFRTRFIGMLGTAARAVAFLAPALALAGYGTAADRLTFSSILTLALLAATALLQRALRDAYVMVVRPEPGQEGLLPTLGALLLLLCSLPLFALIWGAQITDLTEIWAQIREGVSLGELTLSPSAILTLIIVFTIGYILTRALQSTMRTSILPKTRLDTGGQNAVVSGIGYIGIILTALIAITSAGINLSSLAVVVGALSVGIGFGLQNIVNNFVSGIILLIERPIAEGDWIEVGGQHGTVRDISVRSTRIETFDRTDVIVPNSDFISGTVTNYTRGNTIGRLIVPVGVAYGTDTRRVEEILREIAVSHPLVLAQPAPMILFAGFGADSLDFEIRVILRDVNWMLSVRNEFNHKIAERFVAEGIEIPFAQRDIWLRNPEALHPARPEVAQDDGLVDTETDPAPDAEDEPDAASEAETDKGATTE